MQTRKGKSEAEPKPRRSMGVTNGKKNWSQASLIIMLLFSLINFLPSLGLWNDQILLPSRGIVQTFLIMVSPNPSKINQLITISGVGQPRVLVVIQYSRDQYNWYNISTILTNETGRYTIQHTFTASGIYYFRAISNGLISVCRHVVADFFVALDGSGDFTDIQAAIDALPAEGGTVFVKAGVYVLNPTYHYPYKKIIVRSNLNLIGEGINKTIIKLFPDLQPAGSNVRTDAISNLNTTENLLIANLTLIQNGTPDHLGSGALCMRHNCTNVTIRNVEVKQSFGGGIAIPNGTNILIENCIIDTVWTGIYVYQCKNVTIRGNRVSNTGGDGIYPAVTNQDVLIEKNYVENIGDTGIDLTATSGQPPLTNATARNNILVNAGIRVTNAINIKVLNNIIVYGSISVDAGQGRPYNVTIEGNQITCNEQVAIAFKGSRNCVARNNWIQMLPPAPGVNQSGMYAAIYGTGIIENNTILDAANYGISFGGWGLYSGCNLTIRGNMILNFGDIGIWDDGKGQGGTVVIEQNIIKDTREPFVSRYGIRTDYEKNKWTIRYNRIYAGRIAFISAPNSDVHDNTYEP